MRRPNGRATRIREERISMAPIQKSHRKKRGSAPFTSLGPVIVVLLLAAGCSSIGPGTVDRDRFDYTTAVAESWKSQMLLNIVKLRYGDTPVFLDVPSVISQYAIQGTVNLGAGWSSSAAVGNSQTLGVLGSYVERPTITYTPLSGDKFTRSLLTPISPASLLYLLQSGWPVKLLFELCVKSINDIDNNSTAPGFVRPPDPRFAELVELLGRIQRSGAIGTRLVKKDKWEAAMMTFRRRVDPNLARDLAAARRLMGVDPNATETTVTYGSAPTAPNEIAILTRSIMEIIIEMASQIDVPAEYVAEGRTYATLPDVGSGPGQVPPFSRVQTGKEKPAHTFAAIRNRGHWYWIDDRDRLSKVHFTFLMILFSLTETGTPPQAPLITVPIN
jgi:hypothetical protein